MHADANDNGGATRRGILSTILMLLGVVLGYGAGALHFLEYLVPLRRGGKRREMFIGTLDGIPPGSSMTVRDPLGEEIAITRMAGRENEDLGGSFRALSTKCPHLGCKAYWEAGQQRFRCPCHDGIFDKEGRAISGPPAKEGKNLTTYEVRVDRVHGWVSVMVPEETRYGV